MPTLKQYGRGLVMVRSGRCESCEGMAFWADDPKREHLFCNDHAAQYMGVDVNEIRMSIGLPFLPGAD